MALKGDLHDFSLTQLLNLVHLAHKTGTLTVHGTNDQASLSFSEGKLIYGQGGLTDGHLVSILRHTKHLTEEQARLLMTRPQANNDKELGLLLMHAGYLNQQTIVQAVQQYITDLVLRLFTWSEGSFQFFNGVLPPDDRITVHLDLENLILEGARRMKEWETLQEELPNLDLALKFTDRPDSRLRGINLTVEEWRVVSYVNPKNTIRQIRSHQSAERCRNPADCLRSDAGWGGGGGPPAGRHLTGRPPYHSDSEDSRAGLPHQSPDRTHPLSVRSLSAAADREDGGDRAV